MVKPTTVVSYSFGRLFSRLFWRVHSIEGQHLICFHMDASLSNRKNITKMVYIYIVLKELSSPSLSGLPILLTEEKEAVLVGSAILAAAAAGDNVSHCWL